MATSTTAVKRPAIRLTSCRGFPDSRCGEAPRISLYWEMTQNGEFLRPTNRRAFLMAAARCGVTAAAAMGAGTAFAQPRPKAAIPRVMTVYKDPNCGCCAEWVAHVRKAGFESCHTARIGGYSLEGHVPADVIDRLLREQPTALGLAVPGMPIGSPGMEQGGRKDAYDILLFDKAGKTRVYASR